MISLTSLNPTRFFSAVAAKLAPHRLTLLFGLAVGAVAAATYIYRRWSIQPSLHELGQQAFKNGDYKNAGHYFNQELAINTNPLYIIPYYWRNAADLKTGNFKRVLEGCDHALRTGKPNDQLKAQFYLQMGQANMGLNRLGEAMQNFTVGATLCPPKSKLLAQACYFNGLAHELSGSPANTLIWCNNALEELSDQDSELKVEILILKALALGGSDEAIQLATSALQLSSAQGVNMSNKETLVALYLSFAICHCRPKDYLLGLRYFQQALDSIENDPFLRAYIEFARSDCCKLVAATSPEAKANLLQAAEEGFRAASTCKSDDRPGRSPLLRCMMAGIFDNLSEGEITVTRLAQKIDRARHENV